MTLVLSFSMLNMKGFIIILIILFCVSLQILHITVMVSLKVVKQASLFLLMNWDHRNVQNKFGPQLTVKTYFSKIKIRCRAFNVG